MEFIEMYLAMQDRRYQGRVDQQLQIDPHLLDAIVPTMILQPIVENAYRHGLSRITAPGMLRIEATSFGDLLRLAVTNTGPESRSNGDGRGSSVHLAENGSRRGVGLANVRERLEMHYGQTQSVTFIEIDPHTVQVALIFPLTYPDRPRKEEPIAWRKQSVDHLQNASIQ